MLILRVVISFAREAVEDKFIGEKFRVGGFNDCVFNRDYLALQKCKIRVLFDFIENEFVKINRANHLIFVFAQTQRCGKPARSVETDAFPTAENYLVKCAFFLFPKTPCMIVFAFRVAVNYQDFFVSQFFTFIQIKSKRKSRHSAARDDIFKSVFRHAV